MSAATTGLQLSDKVRQELETQNLRIMTPDSALRMWERLLSMDERAQLGGNSREFEKHFREFGTVGIWMRLKGVSQNVAIIQLAHGIGFLRDVDARWLLREAGERTDIESAHVTASLDHPIWDRANGELRLNGDLIRTLRSTTKPTHGCTILDAFSEDGWPRQIDNPLPGSKNRRRLNAAINWLNEGLLTIRFRVVDRGTAISWSRLNSD